MTIGKIIVLAVIIAMGCAALVFSWPHRAVAQGLGCIIVYENERYRLKKFAKVAPLTATAGGVFN